MDAVWIDPDAARTAVRWWARHGDELHRAAFELEHLLARLALGEHLAAVQHLTRAAAELWVSATMLQRSVDATLAADRSAVSAPARDAFRTDRSGSAFGRASSVFGDPGERGDREVRTPYLASGHSPVERARQRVARALLDTGDTRRIRADEFALVELADDRYVVVLPGVVDLSSPHLGWDSHHRSPRDLDRAALASSRSADVADNPYAIAVADALADAGVPVGARLLIVGHSFGADTALDLAADAGFNGPNGYRVTHVVAAGYHSGPQLSAVDADTDVLVVQNHRDAAVIAESIGAAGVTDAVASSVAALAALAAVDPITAARHQARSIGGQARAVWSAARHLVDRRDELADAAVGVATADPRRAVGAAAGVITLEPGVTTPSPGRVVSVFEGGGDGFGHAPELYASHLLQSGDPAVVAFLESIDAAGYTGVGDAVAIDISVP